MEGWEKEWLAVAESADIEDAVDRGRLVAWLKYRSEPGRDGHCIANVALQALERR